MRPSSSTRNLRDVSLTAPGDGQALVWDDDLGLYVPSDVAAESHNHDDRYYTEDEIDASLASVASDLDDISELWTDVFRLTGIRVLTASTAGVNLFVTEGNQGPTTTFSSATNFHEFRPFRLTKADWERPGKALVFRWSVIALGFQTDPNITTTVGLHTASVAAGTATQGAATAGTTLAIPTPGANAIVPTTGAEFAAPANGVYWPGVVLSGTAAANFQLHIALQRRSV